MSAFAQASDEVESEMIDGLRKELTFRMGAINALTKLSNRYHDEALQLRARVAGLEAMLESIGAGGVGSMISRNHSEQQLNTTRRVWFDYEITELAHRICWRYRHSSDPHHSHTYTFNRSTLLQFARAIEAAQGITGAGE